MFLICGAKRIGANAWQCGAVEGEKVMRQRHWLIYIYVFAESGEGRWGRRKRLSGLCFVGGERKLREKKKGSYRCRLFFSPLTIFWLGVKADTAVLSILAHFPLLCVCVCVSSSPELLRFLPGEVLSSSPHFSPSVKPTTKI
jgi:hypothetical protein